ncbi:MAG TPA: hypothetical protein VK176_13020 [Phycisphaerales bacterium]|nr:hypothetical protein [Phycisphaerales bacterium]
MFRRSALAVATAAVAASAASARTITFDNLSVGLVGGPLEVTEAGVWVTFEADGLSIRDFDFAPFPRTNVLHTEAFSSPVTVTLGAGVRAFSFQNYIYGGLTPEVDLFFIQAFDIDGNLIDTFSGSQEFITLEAAADEGDIARLVIDDQGTGFQVDNVELRLVPTPASTALLALAGLALRRRR